jgi:hypothetical protein
MVMALAQRSITDEGDSPGRLNNGSNIADPHGQENCGVQRSHVRLLEQSDLWEMEAKLSP